MISESSFYVTGGTLRSDAPSYVERQADRDLHAALQRGEFCYVLTSRQMGKSSLMVRTAARLKEEGVQVAILDLTAIGQNLTPEQWYGGLLRRLGRQLDPTGELEETLDDFWLEQDRLGPLQRWMAALEQVVLKGTRVQGTGYGVQGGLPAQAPPDRSDTLNPEPRTLYPGLVIFLDEIDAVRSLPFSTDEFFAGIRECYNRRTADPAFQRVTFCLLGVATPSDLIRDTRMTPFNIGRRIDLTDFTEPEAAPLAKGLGHRGAAETLRGAQGDENRSRRAGEALLKRILYWTGGHPYLTQRLCQAVAEAVGSRQSAVGSQDVTDGASSELPPASGLLPTALVDRQCEALFLSSSAREKDDNLIFVRERLLRNEANLAALLDLYGQVRAGRGSASDQRARLWGRAPGVAADDTNPLVDVLRLSGIVRLEEPRSLAPSPGTGPRRCPLRGQSAAPPSRSLAPSACLRVRNRIYERVFDRDWVTRHMPDAELRRQRAAYRRGVLRATAVAGVIVAVMVGLTGYAWSHQRRAQEAADVARIASQRMDRARQRAEGEKRIAQAALDRERAARADLERALQEARTQRSRAQQQTARAEGAKRSERSQRRKAEVARQDADAQRLQAERQRRLAERRRSEAERERRLALRAQQVAEQRLVRLNNANGMRSLEEGDLFGSLLWFAKARQLDRNRAQREDAYRMRSAAALQQCPKLVQLWFHQGTVNFAEWSPDGRRVVTAGADGSAQVWDLTTGRPAIPPLKHAGPVRHTAFSADSRRVVTASEDRTARVWDAGTGEALSPPLRHEAAVIHAALSPDGRRVVTTSADRTARVWDVATGRSVSPPLTHDRELFSASFSPDGHRVLTSASFVTGGLSRAFRVWDAATGQPVTTLIPHPAVGGMGGSARFTPDGRRVITPDGALWDATSGKQVAAGRGRGSPVGVSPDGRRVVSQANDGTVEVWDTSAAHPLTLPVRRSGPVNSAAFTAAGRVAIVSLSGITQVWDGITGEPITPPLRHSGAGQLAAFSPGGRQLLTLAGEQVRVWDLAGSAPSVRPLEHGLGLWYAAFSPDGRRVVTTSGYWMRSPEARVWDLTTGNWLPLKHQDTVTYAAFSADGRSVVTASADRTARVWEAATGKALSPPLEHPAGVWQATFSRDGRRVLTICSDGSSQLWELPAGTKIGPPLHFKKRSTPTRERGWLGAPLSPDGRRVITVSETGVAQIQELRLPLGGGPGMPAPASWSPGPPLKTSGEVRFATFSPDGRRFVTANANSQAQVWDAITGQLLATLRGHGGGDLNQATFSPEGRRVLTAGVDGNARVWDAATGRPITPPMKHNHWVMHASFSPDGRLVATASWDMTAQVWDATTGEPVTPPLRHGYGAHTAAFSPDGRSLLTSSEDGSARLWTLQPDDRSAPDLQSLAQLFTGQQMDIAAGAVAVESATLRAEWQRLRTRHPEAFAADAGAVLAWHRREADACLREKEWAAAVAHLDAAIAIEPRNAGLRENRGHAHAEMGRWDRAAADFARVIELGADLPQRWYWLALAQLAAGDTADYRTTYVDLVKRFGERSVPFTVYSIALLYALLPNTGADPAVPLRLAEGVVAANPSNYFWLTTLGGVLSRAGRYQEALRALDQADAVQPPRGHARHLLWQALCHARLGDAAEARQLLQRGSGWLAQALERRRDEEPLGWDDRLQMEHLRGEVEALLRSQRPRRSEDR